nr:unnamed protein product [Brassica rapa]
MSDFNFCKMIKANYYSYSVWWSVWWSGTYSMILSKAAFFHTKSTAAFTQTTCRHLSESSQPITGLVPSLCVL